MASYSFTDLRDKVLLWAHGRRTGVKGDGGGPFASIKSLFVLDGVAVGSTRSGPNAIKAVAAGSNGAGAITVAGAAVGDNVEIVVNLSTPADASASFESTVSVAGQVQQTSASNLSGSTYLFCVQPQS
jgi:phage terminase large subunit-like protein